MKTLVAKPVFQFIAISMLLMLFVLGAGYIATSLLDSNPARVSEWFYQNTSRTSVIRMAVYGVAIWITPITLGSKDISRARKLTVLLVVFTEIVLVQVLGRL